MPLLFRWSGRNLTKIMSCTWTGKAVDGLVMKNPNRTCFCYDIIKTKLISPSVFFCSQLYPLTAHVFMIQGGDASGHNSGLRHQQLVLDCVHRSLESPDNPPPLPWRHTIPLPQDHPHRGTDVQGVWNHVPLRGHH